MKSYICTHEESFGDGLTLKEAYDTLAGQSYDNPDLECCTFYEVEQIEVEFKIEKKAVVSKISKKTSCEN